MTTALPPSVDVIVVGGGNAAFCAALAAAEQGVSVLVLERAPEDEAGGNSRFTAGAFRCVYNGVEDLRALMPDLTDEEVAKSDFGTYTEEKFFDDMGRITEYRTDPDLCELLVKRSKATMLWMRDKGVRFMPIWGRQAYKIGGMFKFWGGLTVEAVGGGPGLVDALTKIACKNNIAIAYGARAFVADRRRRRRQGRACQAQRQDRRGEGQVRGARCRRLPGRCRNAHALSGAGLGARQDPRHPLQHRRRHQHGARDRCQPIGNWSGGHAVAWDRNAPEFGDLTVGDNFQKHSYPWGIMINANGERFLDEGSDFRNYTYAKNGRIILMQPKQFAYQVFDNKIIPMLRDEYRIKRVSKVRANTLEELVQKMEDVNAEKALATIKEYNKAVMTEVPFDPNVKDGRGTRGLAVPKSNWANTIDEPPFEAYAVTCGLTFTFGGLKIDTSARVIDIGWRGDPGAVRYRRTGRRDFLVQLSRRYRPDERRRVRQDRRHHRRPARQAVAVTIAY